MKTRKFVTQKTDGLCAKSAVHPTAGLICYDNAGRQAAVIGNDGDVSFTDFSFNSKKILAPDDDIIYAEMIDYEEYEDGDAA